MSKEHLKLLSKQEFRALTGKELDVIQTMLGNMESFKNYPFVVLSELFQSKKSENIYVATIQITQFYESKRRVNTDIDWNSIRTEEIIICQLSESNGYLHIRPKTLYDRLVEFFSGKRYVAEVLFEFNRKYQLITDEETNVVKGITIKLLEAIARCNHIFAEIRGDWMIIRRMKQANTEELSVLLTVVNDLVKIV